MNAENLVKTYSELFPDEKLAVNEDTIRIFNNWLNRLRDEPQRALATVNWCGKVTKAFFTMHGMRTPKTKLGMMQALSCIPRN